MYRDCMGMDSGWRVTRGTRDGSVWKEESREGLKWE